MARGNNQSQSTSVRSEFSPYSVRARAYPMVWQSGTIKALEKEYAKPYKKIGKGKYDLPADKKSLFEIVGKITQILKNEFPAHTVSDVFVQDDPDFKVGDTTELVKNVMVRLSSPTNQRVEVFVKRFINPIDESTEDFRIRIKQIADRVDEYGNDLQEFNDGRKFINERRKPKDDF